MAQITDVDITDSTIFEGEITDGEMDFDPSSFVLGLAKFLNETIITNMNLQPESEGTDGKKNVSVDGFNIIETAKGMRLDVTFTHDGKQQTKGIVLK